jgi:peptidoglycan/xylan/chitin deacetylase (PgdA/CDA1 family)
MIATFTAAALSHLRMSRSPPFPRVLRMSCRLIVLCAPYKVRILNGVDLVLRILTYHRIDSPNRRPDLDPGLISASPAAFAEQVAYVARKYDPVDLAQLFEARNGGSPLPTRAVLFTFDDGYRDFADNAWPILKRAGIAAVVFVPTAYPDHPERSFWWDRLYRAVNRTVLDAIDAPRMNRLPLRTPREKRDSLGRLRVHVKNLPAEQSESFVADLCERLGGDRESSESVLGWDEIRRLAAEGVTFASHGENHFILTRCTRARVRGEILNSQATLEREIGPTPRIIAYPNGAENEEVRNILREEKFDLAFARIDGHSDLSSPKLDPLRLCRTNISPRTTLPIFRLRLKTWFSHIDRWRHREVCGVYHQPG